MSVHCYVIDCYHFCAIIILLFYERIKLKSNYDHLQYELLFCIEDKNDPAIAIVNTLMEKYPLVDAHLFLGGSVVGVNPKINNMQPGYEAAKYEYIMISDSGIRSKFY